MPSSAGLPHDLPPDTLPPFAPGETVADRSERELVARIAARLPPAPEWMLVGIGDDAAVVEPERNRVEVLTVDALVEGIHFDRGLTTAADIGHRALAVNLSDLAAMGAVPRLALLSFVLPSTLSCADFDGLVAGIARLAAEARIHVAGGNLTRTAGPLVVDVTVTGTIKRHQAMTRAGARPGDEVYVTGTIGAAVAGLQMLQTDPRATGVCVDCYQRPTPRLRAGQLLSRNRVPSACVDLSDGLADGVHRIAEASGVGVVVMADDLPLDDEARAWLARDGADPVDRAIAGGDDYELLFTVHPRRRRRLAEVARQAGVPFTRVGVCVERGPMVLRRGSADAPIDQPLPPGYTHFR